MTGGLKNRGKSKADVDERRMAVEEYAATKLPHIGSYSFDPLLAEKNVENMIGCLQVPLGFAGPLAVKGDHAKGEFLVPMATTEGALLASVNRGCSAITAAGGANVVIIKDEMTRAPVFRTKGVRDGQRVAKWVDDNYDVVKRTAEATTSHGKLLSIKPFASGRSLFLRFSYDTGDAMGMNMATIATEAASRLIEKETGAVLISVSGNMCIDKKPAAIDSILGRGKLVLADVTVPRAVVEERLKTTVAKAVETNYRKNLVGSALASSLGFNAHVANIIAAVYLATGQDPAQVAEASMAMTNCEDADGDLYVSVRLPCLELGTVGGGTRLPCQKEALSMIDCVGAGKVKRLAEIVAALALAGELSTLAAQSAGELGKAHQSLGR
ncbi:MAG: 3-hydroxy-3-methylglutaryl-coenzyme A reductase [Methanomassiliicoccales archaeon PtaU1.Bin124]|nr:MAG: 3-hydroxy-3-methylglutaryl-coenzyme A reductase [Methanomassiliicoccales archaeon PtaU1.Bin124]